MRNLFQVLSKYESLLFSWKLFSYALLLHHNLHELKIAKFSNLVFTSLVRIEGKNFRSIFPVGHLNCLRVGIFGVRIVQFEFVSDLFSDNKIELILNLNSY